MRIAIKLGIGANENAVRYYDDAKKWKKKLGGLSKGMDELKRKISAEEASESAAFDLARAKAKRVRKWFEKFHWFFTSEGFLVLSGRDAKSNEILVNKYMSKDDIYFHAEIYGASHTVLKVSADGVVSSGAKPSSVSLSEAACFAAVMSSAWRDKVSAIDVYSARPEQVTKKAPSGESIGTGAFMVYGQREWYRKTPLDFAIGFRKIKVDGSNGKNPKTPFSLGRAPGNPSGSGPGHEAIHGSVSGVSADGAAVGMPAAEFFSGPEGAVKSKADFFVLVKSGEDSKGDAAKKVARAFLQKLGKDFPLDLDEIVSLLPSGEMKVVPPKQ